MNTVYLVRNDNNSQVVVTLTREDTGNSIDLTNATVRLKIKRKGTPTVLLNLVAIEASDFENGEAVFAFSSGNLSVAAGEYIGEIETTFSNGNIETTYDEIEFVIRDDY